MNGNNDVDAAFCCSLLQVAKIKAHQLINIILNIFFSRLLI